MMHDCTPVLTEVGKNELLSRLKPRNTYQYLPDMGVKIAVKGTSKTGETVLEISVTNEWGLVIMTYPEIVVPPLGYVQMKDFGKVTVTT